MTEVFTILDKLESTQGTKAKIELLKKHISNTRFCKILDLTYNYKYTYYIKKYQTGDSFIAQPPDINWNIFLCLLIDLRMRNITGNAAIQRVEELFNSCSPIERKWYDRVLQRDLRCGINVSTIKEAGIDIPEFEVQLAKDGKKCKKLKDIIKKGVFLSPKYDGYRCVAILHEGAVTLLSRSGTLYENFPEVEKALMDFYRYLGLGISYVLDGEIMSDDFNCMQQTAFASVRGTTVGDEKYHIFDMVEYSEWSTDNFVKTAKARYDTLTTFINGGKGLIGSKLDKLVAVVHKWTDSYDEAMQFEQDCIALGFEGGMINPDIPYYRGKVSNKMLKLKTFESQECIVKGVVEGKGKNKGRMGALLVTQENGKECEVGSGFKDVDRDYIWSHPDETIGRMLEAKYQELTPDEIMRFPTFKKWRDSGNSTGKK